MAAHSSVETTLQGESQMGNEANSSLISIFPSVHPMHPSPWHQGLEKGLGKESIPALLSASRNYALFLLIIHQGYLHPPLEA